MVPPCAAECQRSRDRRPRWRCHVGAWRRSESRVKTSLLSRRPRVVRRMRPSGLAFARGRSAAHAMAARKRWRVAVGGDAVIGPQARGSGASALGRRPAPRSAGAAGRQPAGGERGDLGVEPGGIPATRPAVERVRARADRLVRQPAPVGQVVPALVAGTRPVRDLVAAPAVGRKPVGRHASYCAAARSSSCSRRARSRQRRAPGGVGRWSPRGPGQSLCPRIVEGQGVEPEVVGRRVPAPRRASGAQRLDGLARACRRAGPGSPRRCSPVARRRRRRRRARRDVAGRAA